MLRISPSDPDRVPNEEARTLCLSVRERKQWTQGQLAKHLRVSRKLIENIEQDRVKTASKDVVAKLKAVA